jgi:hypothetical protein
MQKVCLMSHIPMFLYKYFVSEDHCFLLTVSQIEAESRQYDKEITRVLFVHLFSWRYNPLWLYFYSPIAGFSLLVFEVS